MQQTLEILKGTQKSFNLAFFSVKHLLKFGIKTLKIRTTVSYCVNIIKY